MEYMENLTEYVEKQASLCQQHDVIDKELYARYGVKRGLRDENGQGVLTARRFRVTDSYCTEAMMYRIS